MKAYAKPTLYCEQFELSQYIASCNLIGSFVNSNDLNSCAIMIPGSFGSMSVFNNGVEGCTYVEGLQDYCATNGGDGVTIFAS